MTPVEQGDARRWTGRPWVARLLRIAVYVVPFLASVAGAIALSAVIPPATSWPIAVVRLVVIAVFSTIVLWAVDRGTRRLLPLAALLDLTLVFPDEAPSRFKVALRSGGTKELERRLEEYRHVGADEPARAAELLLGLVAELSRHDRLTRGHSERVRAYAQMIGEELGLDADDVDKLRWAALLHDVGKLEVPFEILNKRGTLDPDEYEVVKRHPTTGAALAAPLAGWLGDWVRAVGEHHERWDGAGYPSGLRGREISYAARIVAVADSFDVMTSARSYKEPGSAADARRELAECAGSHFDPQVVRAFLSISLGKLRMAMGPLSWLTQLSLFPPGLVGATAAPAMTAVAGVAATAVGFVGGPATFMPPEPAGYIVDAGPVESMDPPTTATIDAGRTGPAGVAAAPDGSTPTDPTSAPSGALDPTVTDTTPTGPTATVVTAAPSTSATETSPVVTTTDPPPSSNTITPPPRPSATTTTSTKPTATTSTTTTTATTSTTTSTTTTTATTSTTTSTTTTTATTSTTTSTTAPPSPVTYLLGSSAAGDVVSQELLPLVQRAPVNTVLPNFDTDRDHDPGLKLKNDGEFVLDHPDRIQRFRLDPATAITIDGRVTLELYAAARDLKVDEVQAAAALVDCPDGSTACTVFATSTVDFVGQLDRFSMLTFDFGNQTRSIPASRNLQVWIISTMDSKHDMWLAYDTVGYESTLTLGT
jgi:putative nucleotidyltransferase with HDIG domain